MADFHYDFESSAGYWIAMVHQSMHRLVNERLEPLGLTYRQMQLIGWLVHDTELTATELARRMLVEPPTLARVLDRMESLGWITRSSMAHDQRCKTLRLTAAAEPVWMKIVEVWSSVRQQLLTGLTDEEIQTLNRTLHRLQSNLQNSSTHREIA